MRRSPNCQRTLVRAEGIEPPTCWLRASYSTKLSYARNWWLRLDSNQGPSGYEPDALDQLSYRAFNFLRSRCPSKTAFALCVRHHRISCTARDACTFSLSLWAHSARPVSLVLTHIHLTPSLMAGGRRLERRSPALET